MASNPVRRILIIRLSALGDVAMASGLIPALRACHPDAHIAWLTEPAAAPLLRHNPRLDELLVWDRPAWQRLWRERRFAALWRAVRTFRRMLRAHEFDLVIDAQGLLKSGLWAWLSGAPRRLGLRPREGSRWLMTERLEARATEPPLIASEYRQLAEHLGAPAGSFQLDVAIGAAAREAARSALDRASVTGPYVVLCPFTTRPQKHWFEERWAALAGQLQAEGLRCVLLGGPGDREAADRLQALGAPLVNLTGQLRLDESAAVIERAALLVGVDTGLTHIGTALHRPTVALFGSTRPYLNTPNPSTHVMYEALACSPCRRRPSCDGRFDCMRAHNVEGVAELAIRLWEGHR